MTFLSHVAAGLSMPMTFAVPSKRKLSPRYSALCHLAKYEADNDAVTQLESTVTAALAKLTHLINRPDALPAAQPTASKH